MYIFLDESGQFKKYNEDQYFVVASFTVGDPRRTEKAIRGWFRTRFPRKMCTQPEIKFVDRKIKSELKLKTLKFITNEDVRIRFVYLLRKNIPEDYFKKDRLLSGHLYTHIIGEVLEMYTPTTDLEFRIFCDKRHLKGIKQTEFRNILKIHLLPLLSVGSIVEIEMIDSASNVNIQIADWIVGALAWYLESKPGGEDYFAILKNNLLGEGRELFKKQVNLDK